jgi:succinyl-CoA synthetase alpha subunit
MYPDAMKKGPVSLISQSGGMVVDGLRLLTFENIGVNKAVSIGNKLNLEPVFIIYANRLIKSAA